tara:strand:+ start:127 stop:321 length:195 start_codon:yes stop_codon:yes gene_type:complete
MAYGYRRKRKRRTRRKRSSGMTAKNKNMLKGAGVLTALFVLMPSIYFKIAELSPIKAIKGSGVE